MPRPAKLIIDTDPGIDDAMAIFYETDLDLVDPELLTSNMILLGQVI